jgi:hypothetical protein
MPITINGSTGISGVDGSAGTPALQGTDTNTGITFPAADTVAVSTGGTERLRVDSLGRLGIGTTSPGYKLHCVGDARFESSNVFLDDDNKALVFGTGTTAYIIGSSTNNNIRFVTNSSERGRWDSSGRFLVGTSTGRGVGSAAIWPVQIESVGSNNPGFSLTRNENDVESAYLAFGKSRGTSNGSNTIVQSGDRLGTIVFAGADGTDLETRGAEISAWVDGTPGANDMPGRLVFSTTADGASSPTERMRLSSAGGLYVSKTDGANSVKGIALEPYGTVRATTDSTSADQTCYYANRQSTDGTLINFLQADISEGSISVSGTTVSYNGAHLSRWSQLPGGAAREEILRGTVLTNIDEMCGWGNEENEQLNRMKVSDVEGDPNVAGVFQAWDDDDDTYTDDFYCAMTGDFIIRIAEGVTVQRGDLLMSAGDGTAKPQDDDIIRSKTIAKVTSTHVTCIYDDGSYCVPCVLMAC